MMLRRPPATASSSPRPSVPAARGRILQRPSSSGSTAGDSSAPSRPGLTRRGSSGLEPEVSPLIIPEISRNAVINRERRLKGRRLAHGAAARAAKLRGECFLGANSVGPGTLRSYRQRIGELRRKAGRRPLETAEQIDEVAVELMEELYFSGGAHAEGSYLYAAIQFFFPEVFKHGSRGLPRTVRALKGFKRLAPGSSRPPLPQVALFALVGAAMFIGLQSFALALLLGYNCYLRPGELLSLAPSQLIRPRQGSGTSRWALILAPEDGARASKTGEFDESVMIEMPEAPSLGAALGGLA